MTFIINFIVFLILKAGEVFFAKELFLHFNMRSGMLLYGFYAFLSLFQMLYFIFQSVPRKRISGQTRVLLLRYTSLITILMGVVTISLSSYFLYILENDIVNVLFIIAVLILWNGLFYLLHQFTFTLLIRKERVLLSTASILPQLTLLLLTFGAPGAYLVLKKLFYKRTFSDFDLVLGLSALVLNFLLVIVLWWRKVRRAKKLATEIRRFKLDVEGDPIRITDENEIGLIQSEIKILLERIFNEKDRLTLWNGYISQHIHDQINEYPPILQGENKNASILTLLYNIEAGVLTPESMLILYNKVISIIGNYADEYDAYPLFAESKARLAFGVPFYYEHQKYHALECAVKILDDIKQLAEKEGHAIHIFAGIFSGEVLTGAMQSAGVVAKNYVFTGESVKKSEKIAEVARKLKKPLLCCESSLEGLRNKFFVEKIYKIKLEDTELTVNQIKV